MIFKIGMNVQKKFIKVFRYIWEYGILGQTKRESLLIRTGRNVVRVATVREKVWKMKFFPGQGKVREFGFESGKIEKVQKVREKSGNFKIFSKVIVFGNVSMS